MLAPLSWLKEFVPITMTTRDLAWRLTELGIGVEAIRSVNGEEVLELEITPNRPDLLSIVGIAREIAAIQNITLATTPIPSIKASQKLSIIVHNDYSLFPRYTGIILDTITIKPSPEWLSKRLTLMNLRPINNIVDITNYVMYEYGIPLHAFDYDEIKGHELWVSKAEGGEAFTTVDNLSYKLPKNAIIIRDTERIIDLCGIKGGLNSGIKPATKTVYLQVTADDPLLIRKASQKLALRSDASAIFERGIDKGNLLTTLWRAANLMMELGGGSVASELIDLKKTEYKPRSLVLGLDRLERVIGVKIPEKTILTILKNLNLSPTLSGKTVTVTVPTFREDLKIEEDIMEEVARVYGYNNFPKTLPSSSPPETIIPHHRDFTVENKLKNILEGIGYSEVYTYSLTDKESLEKIGSDPHTAIRLTNPISREYEYLRTNLLSHLLEGLKLNEPITDDCNLFEYGKTYHAPSENPVEQYEIAIVRADGNYRTLKGCVETLLLRLTGADSIVFEPQSKLNTYPYNPEIFAVIKIGKEIVGKIGKISPDTVSRFALKTAPVAAELDIQTIQHFFTVPQYHPVPNVPSTIEDLSFTGTSHVAIGQVIDTIKNTDPKVWSVQLLDSYSNSHTFRVTYQDPQKTLESKEVKEIREKIIHGVNETFHLILKS